MQNVGLFCMYFIGICTFFSKWRLRSSVTDALFIGEEGSVSRGGRLHFPVGNLRRLDFAFGEGWFAFLCGWLGDDKKCWTG